MFINRIQLTNFDRLTLNNIRYFKYEPTSSETITGSNGAGKSSLLGQLSPILNDKKDFKDGKFELDFSHRGKEYSVSYENNKFSFKENDIELNVGHTMKVQNNLIKEILGLTPFINDVFLNKRQFVSMSINERKEWLTVISPTDYTYVISVFKKAKDKLRDMQGAMRHSNSRLIQIERDLITEVKYKELGDYINTLRNEIEVLLRKRVVENNSVDVISELLITISRLNLLNSKKQPFNNPAIYNSKIDVIDNEINLITKDLDNMNVVDITPIDKLESERDFKTNEIKDKLFLDLTIDNIKSIYVFIKTNVDELRRVTNEYFRKQIDYDITTLDRHISIFKVKSQMIDILNKDILTYETSLQMQSDNKANANITCPECTHEFKHGYDKTLEDDLKQKISIDIIKRDDLQKVVDVKSEIISEITNFVDIRNELNSLIGREPILASLNQSNTYTLATTLLSNIDLMGSLYEDVLVIEKIDEEIKVAKLVDFNIVKLQTVERDEKIKRLGELHRKKRLTNLNLEYANKQQINNDNIRNLQDRLIELESGLEQYTTVMFNQEINKHYDEVINLLKEELTSNEELLRLQDNDLVIYSSIKNDVEQQHKDIIIMTNIVNALSPNKGLIAKSIIGFLNTFITQVNDIISSTWSYDMKVLVPDVLDTDLDYKFPVIVEGKRRDDISKTSTGMTAIINLAFKLASMSFLNMKDFPIYLDEFGSSFDSEHRRNAVDLIKKIQNDFSQVFMISHYDDVLYAIDNNIITLSIDEVEMIENKKYNKNVTIG